ncbi:MAG: hypothetical protein NDI94_00310 [Candidatus Woesearchaeota archaeon]|nr:hypothetical protein [Candidatus Woesearchaeota archaeon]
MLLLKCPKCKHEMKYNPSGELKGKKKRCVYCGFSFSILTKEGNNIVRELK